MTTIFILLTIISIGYCAKRDCNGDTNTLSYDQFKTNQSLLYQRDTFGNNFNESFERCTDMGLSPRKKYLKVLDFNQIQCDGMWCIDGEFSCRNAKRRCFEMEHIIDQTNTPYSKCGTNILGNLIMSYGVWNNQIGQKCWNDVSKEKMEIYGPEIFCQAIKNVTECSRCDATLPEECLDSGWSVQIDSSHESRLSGTMLTRIVMFVLFLIVIFIVVMMMRYKFQARRIEREANMLEY